jgi:hypothetical protein
LIEEGVVGSTPMTKCFSNGSVLQKRSKPHLGVSLEKKYEGGTDESTNSRRHQKRIESRSILKS